MTVYDRLKSVLREEDMIVLDYFIREAKLDNDLKLSSDGNSYIDQLLNEWFFSKNHYYADIKQLDIVTETGLTKTNVNNIIQMFCTYPVISKNILQKKFGAKKYAVNIEYLESKFES